MTRREILVYNPEPGEAAAYAELIKLPRPSLGVHCCTTPAEAERVIGEAEILYAWDFPRELLPRGPKLRWVQNMGAGVERFLVPELPSRVLLTRAAGIFGSWMAEYTFAWCLWVTQRVEAFREQQRAREWRPRGLHRLRGATLCVVGLGDIGRAIARVGRAFGMTVVGVSRSGRRVPEASASYRVAALPRALARADFAVLTVPLTQVTRGLIGRESLAAMKPSAWLINIARGRVVDEAALLEALHARRIGGAVLDVFDEEPLQAGHPFWGLDNLVVTPHIAGPSLPGEIAPIFNENLRRYLAGRPLKYVVNRRRGY